MTDRLPTRVRASAQLVGESAQLLADVVEFAGAPVVGRVRSGASVVLLGMLRLLGGIGDEASAPVSGARPEEGEQAGELLARRLLDGHGRLTRVQVAEQAGVELEQARTLWRALGLAEVDDDERAFTSADVAALADVAGLVSSGVLDPDSAVALARPFGHLLNRLAAAQVALVADVLGDQIDRKQIAADGQAQVAAAAVGIAEQLLPVLERTTVYVWRRQLATEAGRALLPAVSDERGPASHGRWVSLTSPASPGCHARSASPS